MIHTGIHFPREHQGLKSAIHQQNNCQHGGRIPSCPHGCFTKQTPVHSFICKYWITNKMYFNCKYTRKLSLLPDMHKVFAKSHTFNNESGSYTGRRRRFESWSLIKPKLHFGFLIRNKNTNCLNGDWMCTTLKLKQDTVGHLMSMATLNRFCNIHSDGSKHPTKISNKTEHL